MHTIKVLLFTTSGCHLCELAEAMIWSVGAEPELIEIADDDQLFECYGLRIPVLALALHDEPSQELGWPFDEAQLRQWLGTSQN